MSLPTGAAVLRVKLDENLGERGRTVLLARGMDVCTVHEQSLTRSSDITLAEICRAEDRCMVTLDLDFANPLAFPPERYAGLVVLRIRDRITLSAIEERCVVFAEAAAKREVRGRLR